MARHCHGTQADSRGQLPWDWCFTTDEETRRHLKDLPRVLQRGTGEPQAPYPQTCCLSSSWGLGLALDLMHSPSLFQVPGFRSLGILLLCGCSHPCGPENSLALLCPPGLVFIPGADRDPELPRVGAEPMRRAERLAECSGKLLCPHLCSVSTARSITRQTALNATSAIHWLMAATSACLSAA